MSGRLGSWLSVFFGQHHFSFLHRGEFRTGLSTGCGSSAGGFRVLAFVISSLVAAHLLLGASLLLSHLQKKGDGLACWPMESPHGNLSL